MIIHAHAMLNSARILDPQRRSRGACHYCHFEPAGLCRLHFICQLLTSFFSSFLLLPVSQAVTRVLVYAMIPPPYPFLCRPFLNQ